MIELRDGLSAVVPGMSVTIEEWYNITEEIVKAGMDEDLPLWYQVKYHVVGRAGEPMALSDFTPTDQWEGFLPEAGLSEHNHLVTVILSVRDALGAGASLELHQPGWCTHGTLCPSNLCFKQLYLRFFQLRLLSSCQNAAIWTLCLYFLLW